MTQKIDNSNTIERPPVVAVMGHVDHGKSTLLDYIRKTNTVDKEAGGITQHVGAYEVVHQGPKGVTKKITFIDTPGHAAFTSIRSRGAQIADLAILVVAADDGVKPQTLEALSAIKNADIPYIVAINKIDKSNTSAEKTRQSLAENGIYVEGYGGDIPSTAVSAKTGAGVDELLELILITAELAELKANPTKQATGVVVESHRETRMGVLVTLIIKDGSLRQGDFVVINHLFARVRTMRDQAGKNIIEASASSPVQISGFTEIPAVGSFFVTASSKKNAELFALDNKEKISTSQESSLITNNTESVAVPVAIKADTVGALEAFEKELLKEETEKVRLKIISRGVGTITEGDIKPLTGATNPLMLGFNVNLDKAARDMAENKHVPVHLFNIIYKASEFLAEEFKRRTPIDTTPVPIGSIKILKTFGQTKKKQVIGGEVKDGIAKRGARVIILRREVEVGEGRISALQLQKIPVDEVDIGKQCGIEVESRIEIAPGDTLSVYKTNSKI